MANPVEIRITAQDGASQVFKQVGSSGSAMGADIAKGAADGANTEAKNEREKQDKERERKAKQQDSIQRLRGQG